MTGNRWNQGGRWLAGPLAILVTGLAMAGGWLLLRWRLNVRWTGLC